KMQIEVQWQQSEEPHVARIREYVQSTPGQDALAVLVDMFSDEVFAYGGADISESFKLFMELNSVRRTAPFPIRVERTSGEDKEDGKNSKEMSLNRVIEILDKHADKFKVPTMVIGFRIKDQARAKRELDELHSQIRNVLDEKQPELAAH